MATLTIPPESNLRNQIIDLIKNCFDEASRSALAPPPAPNPSELLDDQRAAKILGIAKGTLAVWRYKGKGPVYLKIGSNVRYRFSDLQKFIDSKICKP